MMSQSIGDAHGIFHQRVPHFLVTIPPCYTRQPWTIAPGLVLRPAVLRTAIASLARGNVLLLQAILFRKPWRYC